MSEVGIPTGARLGRLPPSAALVAAAGGGTRLGRGPKAFLSLAGLTLLERAVAGLGGLVDEVIVAVPERELGRARSLVPGARVISGGGTRQQSVLALAEATAAELVVVHDVARPFLPVDVTRRAVAAARRSGAASAARAVADTLVGAADGRPVEREALRSVQTPQVFDRELLLRAHLRARSEGRSATDDAALVRAVGAEVELVEGSPWLFKLTGAEDLAFAEALAVAWDALPGWSEGAGSEGG